MSEKKDKFKDLRWVRAICSDLIPKYLVEQVKHREFTVEDFYKYQNLNCYIQTENGMEMNPLNHLYLLVNGDNIVKGFLWFVVDPLCKNIFINTLSVDNEYWGGGKAVEMTADHVKKIMKEAKLKKTCWITRYPKHSEKHGFNRSRDVIMQYMEEEDG